MSWLPRMFGIIPFGIGISVLWFLWFDGDDFHSPPLFFKVSGSFVALGFVMVGTVAFSAGSLINRNRLQKLAQSMQELQQHETDVTNPTANSVKPRNANYGCPNCGAELGAGADVSPGGDVKCNYCKRWFNIHRQ
jgi:DNA-directed RNA polymerase subunit RPC12/RpoP